MKLKLNDYDAFQSALHHAKHIVVLAGAGLSAGSGIPTFRGAGGFWRTYVMLLSRESYKLSLMCLNSQNAMKLASPQAFDETPSLVWQFYHYRREMARAAAPNPAHRAIALLSSSPDELKRAAPSALTFQLVTQNVDNLSIRALPPDAPQSAYPIEMHGNLFRVKCTQCDFVELNFDSPICSGLAGTEESLKQGEPDPHVDVKDLPKCRKCGGLLRPGVVWFGEDVEHMEDISEMVDKKCDLILVVGTSAQVIPAAIFAEIVKDNGGKVAVFNIELSSQSKTADFGFIGPCEETLVKALGLEGRIGS